MQTVLFDFNNRVAEINDYFSFIEDLLNERVKLVTLEEGGKQTIRTIDRNLSKTLKANGFLLLYNLVESSMRNAIEAIFDELQSQRIPFDAVRVEIKKVVLQNFKNRSPDDIHTRITDISIDIIVAGFKSSELFSGNIDRREIVKTARKYGFSVDTDYSKTKHGENLSVVMKNRNDLAHGNKSFTEVGKDISIEDIRKVKEEVIAYIGQILKNIETYLDAREYLDVSQDIST